MFLRGRLSTFYDNMNPNHRRRFYRDYFQRGKGDRKFEEAEQIWVRNVGERTFKVGVIVKRTGDHSYLVLVGGVHKRKHTYHM